MGIKLWAVDQLDNYHVRLLDYSTSMPAVFGVPVYGLYRYSIATSRGATHAPCGRGGWAWPPSACMAHINMHDGARAGEGGSGWGATVPQGVPTVGAPTVTASGH